MVLASGSGRGEFKSSRKKFSGVEGGAKGQVRLFRGRGSAELRKVASGSATRGLWLRYRKVGSQVIGEDRRRLLGRGTVGEVRRGERRASYRTKERVHRFRVRFGRQRRASRLPCLSFGLGNDRRSTSGSGGESLTIFVTSVSWSVTTLPVTILKLSPEVVKFFLKVVTE